MVALSTNLVAQNYHGESVDKIWAITLKLNEDHTYILSNGGDSCWLWWSEAGTWSETRTGMKLTSRVTRSNSATRLVGSATKRGDIAVYVEDSHGRPLRDARVTLNYHTVQFTNRHGTAIFTKDSLGADPEWIPVA